MCAAACCVLLLAACGGGDSGGDGEAAAGDSDPLKLAFVVWSLEGSSRQQHDVAAFEAQAKRQGDEAIVLDSRNDVTLQKSQIEQLITQDVDAVVLWSIDVGASCAFVRQLEQADIPAIAYNDAIPDCEEVDFLISRDNYTVGLEAGKAALEAVPSGNYVLAGGDPAANVAQEFHRGWKEALDPAVESGDIEIVSEQFHKDWSPEAGLRQVEAALTKNDDDIQAVIASWDAMGLAILGGLKRQGLDGEIFLSGHDADLAMVRAILDGGASYTAWTPTDEMGGAAAEVGRTLALGKQPTGATDVKAGDITVPAKTFVSTGLTSHNIGEWLCEEQYYTVEEVYKGTPESEWPDC